MPKTSKVAQKRWLKGVNAAAQSFAQPPGSFPRASNLLFPRRGSLATCDGSQIISEFNGVLQPVSAAIGPMTDLMLYEPPAVAPAYFNLLVEHVSVGAPAGLAVAAGSAGPLTGVYKWVVTALDGVGGETVVSNEATQTLTAQRGNVTWTAVTNATGYNIYRTVSGGASGTEHLAGTSTANSFFDNVADGSLGSQVPPSIDTTQITSFFSVPANSYGASLILKFPATALFAGSPPSGAFGGTGGGTGLYTPAGGVIGVVSPIPQTVQFNNLMILALGNGIAPYSSDGTTPNTIKLANTFQASYGSRVASTAQNVGDQISVTIGPTNYIFTCTQAGITSAGGAPAFSATPQSIVADGTVYWQNTGSIAAVTAPRGAAHAIVYAGSLWVLNTSPTTTSDNFDGPSCLKMSDLNNPNSWNPLNVAFLDRDDGTQGTGLATFTIAESGIPPVGSLVAFKDFSTFQINGVFGASNFSIARAQTDMGCVAGRTIQFVPGFGIVRLSHLGFAMFDGVRDRLLSEEIRPYLFGGQPDIAPVDWGYVYFSKGAQAAQPPMYVCACPILQAAPTQDLAPPTTSAVNAGGNNLPPGTYYFVWQVVRSDGSYHTTAEFSVVCGVGTGGINISFPTPTANDVSVHLYFDSRGAGFSGQENRYLNYVPGQIGSTPFQSVGLISGTPGSIGPTRGKLTRIFCYDLVLKAWGIVDLPFPISALRQFRTIGTIPITVAGGFNDAALRRWLGAAGLDLTWDAGATNAGNSTNVQWSVRLPEVFGKDASDRVYFRQLAIRGIGNPIGMQVQITINGVQGSTQLTRNVTVSPMGGGEFAAYADIGLTGVDASAILSGSGPIEIQSVDWLAIPKATRGRVTTSV